ncbi:MAG: hypothetical protein V4658_07810 [Bacteroidota bacterium]
MNEKLIRNIILLLLVVSTGLGLYAMISFSQVNRIRADEFLSFLHSDPSFHPVVSEVWSNISKGADNSYIHAVLLQQWFMGFGAGIISQRLLSFLFWAIGGFCLWMVLNEQQKTVPHKLLFWVLVQFSNMGFLLANDGRFYSMHYSFMLVLFLLVLRYTRSGGKKLLPALSLVVLLSLLTTALSAAGFVLLLLALLLLTLRKLVARERFIGVLIACAIPLVVYFSLFRIESFHRHFSTWLFSKPTADALSLKEFMGTPFRFMAMVDVPGMPDAVGVVVTLVLAGALLYVSRSKPVTARNHPFFFINELFLLFAALFVFQLIAHVIFGWPLWPYRYYAGMFWVFPLWLYQYTDITFSKNTAVLTLLLCAGIGLRMLDENAKIAERRKQIPVAVSGQTIFVEEFENYKTLAKMGEQYIRYPQARPYLFLRLDSSSTERNAYFFLLQQQGDNLETTTAPAHPLVKQVRGHESFLRER